VTRFVVDCETLLRIVAGETTVAAEHTLVAPTLVRSQALAALYEAARRGEISAAEGIERVTRINSLKVRFLGDKVLQRKAWKVADHARLGDDVRRGVRSADAAPGGRVHHFRRPSGAWRSPGSSRRRRSTPWVRAMAEVILFHHALGVTDGVRGFLDQLRDGGHQVTTGDLFGGNDVRHDRGGCRVRRALGWDEMIARSEAAIAALPRQVVIGGFSLGCGVRAAAVQTRDGALGALLYHGGEQPARGVRGALAGPRWVAGPRQRR
jgi:hypothetical protein